MEEKKISKGNISHFNMLYKEKTAERKSCREFYPFELLNKLLSKIMQTY